MLTMSLKSIREFLTTSQQNDIMGVTLSCPFFHAYVTHKTVNHLTKYKECSREDSHTKGSRPFRRPYPYIKKVRDPNLQRFPNAIDI